MNIETMAHASRFAETNGRIIKLPGGCWRAWVRHNGQRFLGYGSTRANAIRDVAVKLFEYRAKWEESLCGL